MDMTFPLVPHLWREHLDRCPPVLLEALKDGVALVRHHDLECVESMPKDPVKWPCNVLVQLLCCETGGLLDVSLSLSLSLSLDDRQSLGR